MADRLLHRGPDGEGFFIWPSESPHASDAQFRVGLGNRRLAVIDPRGGQQPISNEDGTVTVVYNGEIYNYRELRSSLEQRGHRFRTQSDTEVIVHQYEQDGWRCVERFRGMFAFALWDAPNRLLLLGRDRIGIKPLYYTVQGQQLYFSSELSSLFQGLGRFPALDPIALVQLFVLQYVPSPQTLFPRVFKLPPGSVAIWKEGTLQLVPYWTASSSEQSMSAGLSRGLNEDELVRELQSRLDDAVASHLVSDVPLGAFLSGGLDSSLIVATMQKYMGEPVRTFAVGFEGMAGEGELEYARTVATAVGTTHRELVVTAEQFGHALPQVIGALDDPVLDPALVPTFLVSRLARQEVTVVLTGEGADELFGGYQRYRLQRWSRLISAVPGWLRPQLLSRVRSLRIRQALEAYWADGASNAHLQWMASGPLSLLRSICVDGTQFDEAIHLLVEQMSQVLTDGAMAHPAAGPSTDQQVASMLHGDLRSWLPDDLLVKVDRMSMAVSLEARVPYLDHPLVEWVEALPVAYKVRGRIGKYLLKRAAVGRLPSSTITRRKEGFSPPLNQWLRGDLGRQVAHDLATTAVNDIGFWDRKTIERWLGAHRRGEDDYSLLIWGLWSFSLWYDHAQTTRRSYRPIQDAPVHR